MKKLYHGSSQKIEGLLKPVVFATDRADLAALFSFPIDKLSSIGFEQDIAYICIWGKPEEVDEHSSSPNKSRKGYLYILPETTFEKVGKDYEWQSFVEVKPLEVKEFDSVIQGMMETGVQVYFINDDPTFDKIVANKDHRAPILKNLISENQKRGINTREFDE